MRLGRRFNDALLPLDEARQNNKAGARSSSGCLSNIATHTIDPLQTYTYLESGPSTSGFRCVAHLRALASSVGPISNTHSALLTWTLSGGNAHRKDFAPGALFLVRKEGAREEYFLLLHVLDPRPQLDWFI